MFLIKVELVQSYCMCFVLEAVGPVHVRFSHQRKCGLMMVRRQTCSRRFGIQVNGYEWVVTLRSKPLVVFYLHDGYCLLLLQGIFGFVFLFDLKNISAQSVCV